MITTHKKHHGKRLSPSIKQIIGFKAIRNEETLTHISHTYECSRGTVYAQRDKALLAVNQAFEEDDNEVLYYIVCVGEIRVELSDKAKRLFAYEAENVFMTHGLLGQGLESRVNYPENTIGLN